MIFRPFPNFNICEQDRNMKISRILPAALGLTASLLGPAAALAESRSVTATVYHPYYNNRTTYCGDTYSDHRISAAHPWLACGTRVLVQHRGKSLVVPITDRCECTSIDLSYEAARRLGVPTDGIATVRIREL